MPTRAITLHEEASADYDAAFDWYLTRSPDAAVRFDEEVERAISQIARAPQRWVQGSDGTRRFLLRGFPHVLIYREVSSEVIQVVAIAHASRRPGYWKHRA